MVFVCVSLMMLIVLMSIIVVIIILLLIKEKRNKHDIKLYNSTAVNSVCLRELGLTRKM